MEIKRRELEGLTNLIDAYTKNPSTGDPDDVRENLAETQRTISLLETVKRKYQVSIQIITSGIGSDAHGS